MKKVLILTYYFPPYTGIEGNRPASWVKDFKKYGLFPIVFTRQWAVGGQKNWEDYIHEFGEESTTEELENATVIRLPHRHKPLYKKYKERLLSPYIYWGFKFIGDLHIETDAYNSFQKFLKEYLSKEKIDILLVTSPPLNIVRLGSEISEQFGIPLIVDFRDSYNNNLLQLNPSFTSKERVENILLKTYVTKWLKNATLITGVSEPVLNLVDPKGNIPKQLILNGFEEDVFNQSRFKPSKNTDKFTITILGNLYIKQDIAFMLKGFKNFLSRRPIEKVSIQFIGLAAQNQVVNLIQSNLPSSVLVITDRLLREEALKYLDCTNILYYLGWRGFKGIYSGKIFEYLGARRNILIAPSDFDVIDELINKTGSGKLGQTPEEMADILVEWYDEWEEKGIISYFGNEEDLQKFTRENQTKILASCINGILKIKK